MKLTAESQLQPNRGTPGGGEHWFECCCKQSLSCDQSGERCELADERLRCLTGNEQEQFFRTTWPGVMFWNAVKCLLRSLEICLGPSRSVLCEECEGFGLSEMSQVLLFFFYPHFCLSTVTPRWPFHLGFSLPLIKTFSASIQSVRLHQAAAIEIIRAADLMSSHSTQCSCGSKGWHKLSHTDTHAHGKAQTDWASVDFPGQICDAWLLSWEGAVSSITCNVYCNTWAMILNHGLVCVCETEE